jgi:hypothetical protein
VDGFDRRQFLSFSLTGVAPLLAYAAVGPAGRFTPEAFGATGDGARDDYDGFARLVEAVNRAGGGTVALRRGATYLLDRHIAPGNGARDLLFSDCDGLSIEGNGAEIRIKGNFHRDKRSVRSLVGLGFVDCRRVIVRDVVLSGGVERMTRSSGLSEAASHGFLFQSCSGVTIENAVVRHFAADGMYIGASSRPNSVGRRSASRDFVVRNSRFLFNARQGLSIIQLRKATFTDCDFGYSGYLDESGTQGDYGWHAPAAGVDVEPNTSPGGPRPVDVMTGEIAFTGCRMAGNYGGAFLAGQYANCRRSIERVVLDRCTLSCNPLQEEGRYGFIFDVADGMVSNSTLRMYNKTAFIGWYPDNDANVVFRGNSVRGNGSTNPVFVVRPTRGAPLIERNVIDDDPGRTGFPGALVRIENSRAAARANTFVLPAHRKAAIIMNARLAERNEYRAASGSYSVAYAPATAVRAERYFGAKSIRARSVVPTGRERSRCSQRAH